MHSPRLRPGGAAGPSLRIDVLRVDNPLACSGALGTVRRVGSRLVAVTYDTQDPDALARFWGGMLGREPVDHAGAVMLPGTGTQLGLRFLRDDAEPYHRHRMHLHLSCETEVEQREIVERALSLGGRRLTDWQNPGDTHVVLIDPGGYAFCVMDPGNAYMAGTGTLGELTCDGTRDVGLFWSAVLGWPLVWDRDQETAIQSPAGGTKVSWGGEPVSSRVGADRQRLDLAVDGDLDAEIERLVGLGAARVSASGSAVLLTDPDGTEFWLRRP